jgi:DNA-directed RNA polymerase specialized sigma24 family protein
MTNHHFSSSFSEDSNCGCEPCPLRLANRRGCPEERCQFEDDFLELQDSRSSSGRLMYVFVRRSLWQFHLMGIYTEACVLNEAYIRGCQLIDRGETIRNSAAWLRQTVYNIIREWSRYERKSISLEDHLLDTLQESTSANVIEDDLSTLRLALQMLNAKDQQLLNWKIGEGLCWKQIQEAWQLQGYGNLTEASLRKRKERALIKLRKKFHALKPPDFGEGMFR